MKKQDMIKLIILSALTAIAYIPAFDWMIDRWTVKDTYYSHGFLIPFISGFIVWLKRKGLAKIKLAPSAWGWILFGGGIAVYILSALWRIYFTSGFSLLAVLAGMVLLFGGKQYLKELLFPLSFLIFMIPLPLVVISGMSFKLKIFAAQVSTAIVNSFGVAAVRQGSVIKTAHSYVIVEDPCSGIRSLVALIALGALMAYFSQMSRTKKVVLFLSSIPIAVATNVIRIVSVTMASEMYGGELASGIFHDVMGIVVFVLAFFGLSLVAKILE